MLKSAFVWLDTHPTAYWVPAGLASIALCLRLAAVLRAEAKPGSPGRTSGWIDPLVLLLFLFAWRWPFFLSAQDYSPDESQLIAGAITLAHDPVFWRSVDGTTSGPLNFYALLPIRWLGAPLDFFTARCAALLMVWGALWACLNLLRRHAGATVAWLALLPATTFYATVTAPDFVHYSSEHVPFLLLAVAAALLAGPEVPRGWRLAAGAIVAGAVPWAKLQAGPLGAVLILWTAWRVWSQPGASGRPWAALGRLCAAGLAPTAFFAAVSAAAGVGRITWERYFENNLFYVGDSQPAAAAFEMMRGLAMYDGRMPLFLCTVVLLMVGTAAGLVVRRAPPPAFAACAVLLAMAALFVVVTPRRGYLHYTLLLPVPFTLLLGSLLAPWWRTLAAGWTRWTTVLIFVATGLLAPLVTRMQQPVPLIFGKFSHDWRHGRSPEAEVIRGVTPPGGSLAVWGWSPFLYVESGLRQATRDNHIERLVIPHPHQEKYRRQYLDDLFRAAPAVFVDATGPGAFALTDRIVAGHEILPDLAQYIHSHYTQVADLGRSRVYLRNGPDGRPPATGAQITAWLAGGREAPVNVTSSIGSAKLSAITELPPRNIRGRQVTMIHPPCLVEWALPTDARAVELEFGFDPKAVADGASNGVEIVIELQDAGFKRLLHRQYLDPRGRPADREPVKLTISLPPFGPTSKLVLRTDPGPHGDTAWDWVYLGSLAFQRSGSFAPEQFPGFNRVPDAVHAPHSNLITLEGVEVFQAYPPASFMFRLRGDERNLRLAFGLHPSAYTGAGQSDGVTFRVELRRPGQLARPVWNRLLRPVSHPADRGTQDVTIPLGPLQRGDELILRTDFGASINNAWDSTYLRHVILN